MCLVASMSWAQVDHTNNWQAIRDSITMELNDTSKNKWVKGDLQRMLELLENPDSLFPYFDYDAVYHVTYGTEGRFEPAEWNHVFRDHVLQKRRLTQDQIDAVLGVVNNPLLFHWGECGTPFIEGEVIFYRMDKEVASIRYACTGGQLFTSPDNILSRWGILNERGHKILHEALR